jgi:hypothetical protein
MYSFLERYRRIINRPIRTVCLAGEIGGRGVRYKGVKHEGILTDMFLSFDVSKKKQIALHGETLIQYAGRLCGIYDIKAYPNEPVCRRSSCGSQMTACKFSCATSRSSLTLCR